MHRRLYAFLACRPRRPADLETRIVIPRTAERLLFVVLIAVLAISPLPLGSNLPSAWSALTMTVLVTLAIMALMLVVRPMRLVVPASLGLAGLLFLGICGWIYFQTVMGAPPGWENPAWQLALAELAAQSVPSLDPMVGREALARLTGYAGMFALAFIMGQQRTKADLLQPIILAIVTAYAIYGLARHLLGIYELFGVQQFRWRASGTFGNPNIFAAYVNMGVVIALSMLLWNRRQEADAPRFLTAVTRLLTSLLEKNSLLVMALGINLLACIVSASRAGIISLGITAVVVLLIALRGSRWPLFAVAGLVVAFITWGMISSGGETLLDRLSTMIQGTSLDDSGNMRVNGWRLAAGQFMGRPWLGQGYGTFFEAFHLIRDDNFTKVVFDYLHSTWLEVLVELGTPAAIAFLAMLLLLWVPCIAALRRGTRSSMPLMGLAASMVLGLHGMVDFAGQIPALALTWAGIMGLACGRSAIAGAASTRSTSGRTMSASIA
jgi:O-antigen ligase